MHGDIEGMLTAVGMVLCPAIAGAGAVAGALSIHRQQQASQQRSTGTTIAIVILSLVGALLLVAALALGACWGVILMDGGLRGL
ncbi:MAG: hypothetical protein U0234_27760 [Sandaracinus sp.]